MSLNLKKALTIGSVLILVSGCQTTGQKEGTGTGVGAILGGLLGSQMGGKNKSMWVALGVVAGGFLGNRIGQYLDEQDKLSMEKASQTAVLSGKTQSWTNPTTKVSGQARVVSSKTSEETIKVPVLKDKVAKVPPLEIIGQTYRAKSESNLRGGPGTNYVKVGHLRAGETINVVGKVKNEPWYLVSHDGVGSGFVFAQLVAAAPSEKPVESKTGVDKSSVVDTEVAASKVCRTVEQSVTLADGKSESDTVEACQSPSGWERKA